MTLTLVSPPPKPKRANKRWASTLSAGVVKRARRTSTTAARCARAKRHARRMGARPTRREEIAEAAMVRAQGRADAAHRHVAACERCDHARRMGGHMEAYWLALQDALRIRPLRNPRHDWGDRGGGEESIRADVPGFLRASRKRDGVVALGGYTRGRELRANAAEILAQIITGDLRPMRRGEGEHEPAWIATPRR